MVKMYNVNNCDLKDTGIAFLRKNLSKMYNLNWIYSINSSSYNVINIMFLWRLHVKYYRKKYFVENMRPANSVETVK